MLDAQFVHDVKERVFGYISGFYCDDPRKNSHYRLKEIHTYYVYQEIGEIAHELGLDAKERLTAKLVGLLHDVGRFEQFRRFDTFNDAFSVNHSCLGAQIAQGEGFLQGLDDDDKEAVLTAVRLHGAREVPEGLSQKAGFFLRLIRDADKVDIFRVSSEKYLAYMRDPQAFRIEMNIPDEGVCNPEFLDALMNNKLLDYQQMRSMEDMKLLQLGWVYDLNFLPSMRRIRSRRYLEMLVEDLPKDETVQRVARHVLAELERRIEEKKAPGGLT